MTLTAINTNASDFGILLMIRKLLHANVPMTTMNITPTNAAIGICSINGAPNNTKLKRIKAAMIPERRPLPPEFTLIIDCPIMAQPPMPPKNPLNTFPNP